MRVPATAVAGNDAIVPTFPATPSLFVYEIVVFAITAAFVVAVVTSIPAITPSPLLVQNISRAGNATGVIACAVVVVTTSPVFIHK
jgi:hypothetical protein